MKKISIMTAAVFALLMLCVSCVKSDDPVLSREAAVTKLLKKKHRIKIAVAGSWAQKRNLLMEGLELARDEINESGGVLGAQIELVPYDDNYNLNSGGKAAYEIASDNQICAVIGHTASAISVSNSLIYHYYGLLMFSPLSTDCQLMEQGLPYVFRNIPDNHELAEAAAEFCEKSSWKRMMIYYLNNTYGENLANAFELKCSDNDIVVSERESYESVDGVRDYIAIARSWKQRYQFDAIFIAGTMPQVAEIVSIFRRNGITEPIIGGDTLDMPSFFDIDENWKEDAVYCVSNFDSESQNKAFRRFSEAFRKRYGYAADQGALQGYDALKVLAGAIARAKSVKSSDIARALREKSEWNEGAGPYRFNATGDIEDRRLTIKKTTDGMFRRVD